MPYHNSLLLTFYRLQLLHYSQKSARDIFFDFFMFHMLEADEGELDIEGLAEDHTDFEHIICTNNEHGARYHTLVPKRAWI